MDTNNNKSKEKYKDSLTSTLLFSGVQVYQIIIRIVRSKFVAALLGPAGMGITALLRATTDLISTSTNLGLKTSGVKSISSARIDNDKEKIEKTIAVLRKLTLITGLIGLSICASLSPVWSQQSFGNHDYIWSFVAVSLVILLDQYNQNEIALLQGLRQKKLLAKANVIGQTLSLVLTVPLYYFYGVKAIVAVLVLSSLLNLCITEYFVRKVHINRVHVSIKEVYAIGKDMVKLGFLLTIQHIFSQGAVYLVRNYVSQTGGLDQVGLYSAGVIIINMYLGLVFTAMSTDYFPRLAATATKQDLSAVIYAQAEIALLMFAPIIVAFVVFIKPVILLLYSDKFLPIEQMLYWAMAATLIKAMAWSLSYPLLAKAKARVYFFSEVFAILYTFAFNMLGYKWFGLTGFGISMLVSYTLYLLQMMILAKRFLDFHYRKTIWLLFLLLNVIVVLSLLSKIFLSEVLCYVFGVILLLATTGLSFYMLDKRLSIKDFIKNKFLKK